MATKLASEFEVSWYELLTAHLVRLEDLEALADFFWQEHSETSFLPHHELAVAAHSLGSSLLEGSTEIEHHLEVARRLWAAGSRVGRLGDQQGLLRKLLFERLSDASEKPGREVRFLSV